MQVFQTLSNQDVEYLIPTRINAPEVKALETMGADGESVAVEQSEVHVESGSHAIQFLYVPSTTGDGSTVFATNVNVEPAQAEAYCRRYSARWQIESEYKSIKYDFLAKTSSKDYRVRLFYFVFAALLHNIWRLTDFLLKADLDEEFERTPVITAGEATELVASELVPSD
jgi:IS4 transposase